jgi:hypothetical protein
MNEINVIQPYKHYDMWVFDDPTVGLAREPFVAGADAMIDRVVADIPDAAQGFVMSFPASRFRVISSSSTGLVSMGPATGIAPRICRWRVGCVRRCCAISTKRRSRSMCKSRRGRHPN